MEGGKACRSTQGVMQHIVDLGGAEVLEMLAQFDGQAEKAKAERREKHPVPITEALGQQFGQEQAARIKENRIHKAAAVDLRVPTGK